MSSSSGAIVAAEALLVSVAQRFLVGRFQKVQTTRGEGTVVFSFDPSAVADSKSLADCVERLMVNIVKEVTGRTKLPVGTSSNGSSSTSTSPSAPVNFPDIGSRGTTAITFDQFMKDCGETLTDIAELPSHPSLTAMVEVLYNEAASEYEGPATIKDFPSHLCAEGARYDFILKNQVIVRGYSSTSVALIPQEENNLNGSGMGGGGDLMAMSNMNHSMDMSLNTAGSVVFSGGASVGKILIEAKGLATVLAQFSSAPVEENLPVQWRQRMFSLEESNEVLRTVYHSLIQYWQGNTQTEKLRVNATSLLQIVSGDVRGFVEEQVQLASSDLKAPWRIDMAIMERCLRLCTTWKQHLKSITTKDWHGWDGGQFKDLSFDAFVERLQSAVRVRELYETASQLLNNSDVLYDCRPDVVFDGLSLLDTKRTPRTVWVKACDEFERAFSLVESSLAGQMKGMLGNINDPEAKARVMMQYTALLKRESVRGLVAQDLSSTFDSLLHRLKSAQSRFNQQKSSVSPSDARGMLLQTRMCIAEVGSCLDTSRSIFHRQSSEFVQVEELGKTVEKEVVDAEKAVVTAWIASLEGRCDKLAGLEAAVMMSISGDRESMRCKMSPVLRDLLEDVRAVQCSLSGPKAPIKVTFSTATQRALDEAEKLSKQATRTSRIMAAYNSVIEQILPTTKLMLDDVKGKAITILFPSATAAPTSDDSPSTRNIGFSGASDLEGINARFQAAAEAFSTENRIMRRHHSFFTQAVVDLYNIDLLRSPDQWKGSLKEMRDGFEGVEKNHPGSTTKTMYPWRRHWDVQIYKALEHQYQRGLENLNEEVQEFHVDLIFKQGQVQFKPGFESLREAYYTKIREFVGIPQRFKGVGNSEFFATMPSRNAEAITLVHQKAMELFTKVSKVRRQFRDYVVVGVCGTNGAPDLDFLVENLAQEKKQWEEGYALVKDRRRKVSYMEDLVKVDCINISTTPIKASITDHLQKLEDALTASLRNTMQKRLARIDDFVLFASNIIERQPSTLDEVGKANQAYNKFKELVPEYQQQLNEIDEMNARVRIHAGASLEMGVTRSRWEHLMDAMNSHHKQIDQSVSKMRVSVDALIAKFLKDLTRFSTNWNKHKPISLDSFKNRQEFIEKGLNYVKNQVLELGDYVTNGKELREKCTYFRIPEPDFSLLDETQNDIETHEKMWKLYEEFESELEKLRIEDWLTFRSRIYIFEDFLKEWAEKVDALVLERGGQDNIVTSNIKKLMKDWSQAVPVLKFVRGDGYLSEHWAEMFRLLDMDKGMSSDKLTFGDIIGKHALLIEKEKDLKYLNGRAQGEVQIRDAMQDLRTWAMEASFTLITPQEGSTVKVQLITEWKDAMTQVSDNQALIGSLKDSPYFVRFADEAAGWEQKLVAVAEYMVLLNSIQRKWCYLEPLFARGALPHEKPRFTRVDKEFVTILRDVESDPRIMTLAQQDLTDKLKNILDQIDRCQKALNEFLEQKRDKFPRFYFISDEDLLEILGQSKNPTVIQTHLKKLFAGINSVQFDDSKTAILAMVSADNEVVPLSRKVSITDNNVEDWLIRLDECMRFTLRELLKGCVDSTDATQLNVIEKYPSQILQVAEQIFFAQEVEVAIQKKNLKAVLSRWQTKLHDLTGYSLHGKPVTELKVKALILDIIHCIEVVELLEEKRVESTASWWWQKQLRYYPGSQDPTKGGIECLTRMVDTEFNYTFEYQGNAAKLVHTPLTDKCYLVLTNGMHLGYGGNPYGPAGTGKTESVKALGSAMGRQVLVFNCDEGIDFKAMGRIFVGIVKCGAWGCFDEFNRLKVDQLSAISQMIQAIQESLKNNEPSCSLLGRTIDVNPNSGIFVTLNPAGKGYGGRSKLPDNLKQLFRAVAMSVPDNELITATMLQSEGFLHARALSKKVVDVYRLSKQLMSAQQHYDWGLRPLKAVLRLGGSLVQQHRHANPDSKTTEDQEAEFMVQSLRINTISKLTFDDGRLFSGLIADIFPKIAVKEISYKELEVAVEAAFKALHLSYIDGQVFKVLQLYEAMNQRMGVVLVGPSGSGKSTLLKVLRKALQIMNVQVPMHVVNPKALPRQQLLGYMDPDTREWFDGVLSAAARNVVKEAAEVRSWIFCDGDIDPEWVESLNSVLDDNKLLTMPNGVRIQFGSNVNFVFETHSLEFASPATVSRMGIIFLSEQDLHPKYAVASFMDKVPEATRDNLSNLVDSYLYKAIEILTSMENFGVESTRMGLLTIALNHVASAESKLDFACGLIRGLGSTLAPESQSEYALKVFELCGEEPNDSNKPLNTFYNRKKKASASFNNRNIAPVEWTSLQHGGDMPMVRTVEIERISAVLEPLVKDPSCKPFFLVGPEGCGKSMILQNCFQEEKGVRVAVIHCSAQTSAQHVTQKLNQLCGVFSTNNGKVLRPKEGDRLVIALKDINLPKPDKYGTVQLHSLLQQLLLYQGFYDSELEWVGIEKIQIVASMNPVVSAGRFPVASRLLAIVNLVNIPYPSKESLNQVYTAFFAGLLKHPQLANGPQYENGQQLAHCLTNVFEKVKKKFEGEEYAHCIFSPRDITAITCGVLNYSLEGTSLAAIVGYETSRVFADRLASPEDRNRAEKIFTEQLASVGYNGAGGSKDEKEKPIYVSWGSDWPLDPKTPKQLKLLPYADVEKEIKNSLVKYGREFREISMTPVVEVFSWIPRLDRILSSPGGHALLVGRCGVGRRAAATIAAFMLRMGVISVNMTKDYSVKSFRSDLRSVIQRVAVQNEKIMLLLEDHNFTSETFLEMVNSLVSSGEVAGLYTPEEQEQMLAPLREEASNEGFIGNLNNFFLQRIHLNLRVVTIMDPTNILFAPRCQANPGLLTSCAVVWMGTWTSDTTKSICKYVLRKVIKEIEGDSNYKGFHLHREMLSIHESLGQKATPYQFQTFMTSYDTIYQQNGKASSDALQRLEAGLSKLKEAERDVDKIKTDVGKKKIEMQKKQEDADNALTQIQQNIEDSAEQRTQAEELQVKLEAEAKDIVIKKSKAEEELSGIQPILDAAKEAVGGIKSESLNEIRSLRNPPEAVRDVLEGVLALLGVADNSWNGMKKFLGERGVKEQILAFDAKSINSKTRDNVSKLVSQKAQSFKHENIVRASVAAAPMATWVTANVQYSAVLERIGPLTRQLEELEENKNKGEEKLGKLKSKLEKIDKNVEKLRKDFSKMIKEADELKDSLEKAEKQLNTAEELLEKLTGEKDRWSRDASAIREKNKQMPRQALLSAAFLTYLARNSEEVRAEYLKMWSEKLGNSTATAAEIASTVTSFMCTESQLLQYKSEGLPADNLSQENAVAILTGQQTPLIVDPANQAIQWMKNHFQANDVTVEVTSIGDERFTHTLELAIRFGKTLLVTEIDSVDSMLVPVLRKDLISQGPKKVVQLGNKTVDWQDTFRIFLFSRSSDMNLTPDTAPLVTEVNFSVTRSGLESQLLGITIQKENPELETQKVDLLEQEDALHLQLSKLESSLLADLANSHGDLLQNTQLIESLNQLKTQAQAIGESLVRSKELQVELDKKREVYRPYAHQGSVVFFLTSDLVHVNRMYQFSLADFLHVFRSTLETYEAASGGEDIDQKIAKLSIAMAQRAFLDTSRGLFKIDRVQFAMHFCHLFFPEEFPAAEWSALIGSIVGDEEKAKQSLPSWGTATVNVVQLSYVMALENASEVLGRWQLNDESFWGPWVKDREPERLLSKRSGLSRIDALLIVSCFRRDRLEALMTHSALELLKIPALAEVATVEAVIAETKCDVPLLLITSSGADPSMDVQEVAYKSVGRDNFVQIALGGGQTDEAMQQLRRCALSGDWLFLKNLHLVLDWVSVLEKEVASMQTPHENFRLFLTTEAHDAFPIVLLKSCAKMTIEAPPGIRQNLLRTYSTWTEDFLSKLSVPQSQMLFGLAWFHAVVQERRRFIPQGWVKFYEFSQADLKSACDILLAKSTGKSVDWVAVQGLFESAIYGGRLDNDQDTRVLSVFLRSVFNDGALSQRDIKLLGSTMTTPNTCDHAKIIQHIFEKVADTDAPTTFSLPENADRAVQETSGGRYLTNLRALASVGALSSAGSQEALKGLLEPVMAVWNAAALNLASITPPPSIPATDPNPSPLQVFFVSEVSLLSRLGRRIINIYADLKRVADGNLLPSDELRDAATTLANGVVPDKWLDWMVGPESSALWLQLLQKRIDAMAAAFEGFTRSESSYLQQKVRLIEFLRPHTFLNALRQYTARKTNEPMVKLVLGAYPAGSGPKGSVHITLDGQSLALQGATCNGSKLSPLDNNAPTTSPFPDVTISWLMADAVKTSGFVQLPVYQAQDRELHMFEVQVPCGSSEEKDHWTLSGSAIYLS